MFVVISYIGYEKKFLTLLYKYELLSIYKRRSLIRLIKFDITSEYDTNPTRFLRVWVEYIVFESYLC